MLKKKRGGGATSLKKKKKGSNIGSCPQVPVFLFREKTYSKFKVYCKQNRHFYRDFFLGIPDFFNFILV